MSAPISAFDIQLCDRPITAVIDHRFMPPLHHAGAECVFVGRTRLETHPIHGRLVRLEYEAYAPMALRVLNELAREAATTFGCWFVRVHHALGEVPPGAASVMVQVMTGHRASSFDACRFLIDELKHSAPIWKRELWADGTTWSQGHLPHGTQPSTETQPNEDPQ